ncbi:MAG: ribonuclease III [Fusobacteriaceae bacterium]
MNKKFKELEEKIGYTFSNKSFLEMAFIHRSFGNENWRYKNINNERMELLGDAVLDLVVTEYLYKSFVSSSEGELAKLKSMVVSEPVLARISKELGFGEFLLLSKGEEMTGGRERPSILGDCFESMLGAVYLDSDFMTAQKVALSHIKYWIDNVDDNEEILDYKTVLQEYSQKEYKIVPVYEVVKETGPDHQKIFEIVVRIGKDSLDNSVFGKGIGKNKKLAEQSAAKDLAKKVGVNIHETL